MCVVLDDVSTFIYNINHSLMCGVNRGVLLVFLLGQMFLNTFLGGKGEHVLIGLVYFMILTRVFFRRIGVGVMIG